MIQLTLTLKMTIAQVIDTSVTVNNNNSPIQDYVHPDDQTQPTFQDSWVQPFTRYTKLVTGDLIKLLTSLIKFKLHQTNK